MIIYFNNGSNPFFLEFKNSGYKILNPYNNKMKVKIIRKLERFSFLGNWLYNTKEIKPNIEENIIIFDSNISKKFLEWIRKTYPKNRIIFWYWNPVNSVTTTIFPDKIPKGVEKWSYSPKDCRQYKLNYNTTFLFDSVVQNIDSKNEIVSNKKALFVGRDKGRLKELLHLKMKLENAGISCDFHIIGDCQPNGYSYEKPISYDKVVKMIKEVDILVDYYVDETAGLSLRPMEALFFGKKLITNNSTIREYDFYNEGNILVLDEETRDIEKFVRENYISVDSVLRDQYLLSSWIERF